MESLVRQAAWDLKRTWGIEADTEEQIMKHLSTLPIYEPLEETPEPMAGQAVNPPTAFSRKPCLWIRDIGPRKLRALLKSMGREDEYEAWKKKHKGWD